MEPEKLEQNQVEAPDSAENTPPEEKKPSYEPYSRSTRIKAWIGVIFMVILVLGYTYSLATGKIMMW